VLTDRGVVGHQREELLDEEERGIRIADDEKTTPVPRRP
jgi:hypothetical protein